MALQTCQSTSEEVGLFFGLNITFCTAAQGCRCRMSFFFRLLFHSGRGPQGIGGKIRLMARFCGSRHACAMAGGHW